MTTSSSLCSHTYHYAVNCLLLIWKQLPHSAVIFHFDSWIIYYVAESVNIQGLVFLGICYFWTDIVVARGYTTYAFYLLSWLGFAFCPSVQFHQCHKSATKNLRGLCGSLRMSVLKKNEWKCFFPNHSPCAACGFCLYGDFVEHMETLWSRSPDLQCHKNNQIYYIVNPVSFSRILCPQKCPVGLSFEEWFLHLWMTPKEW